MEIVELRKAAGIKTQVEFANLIGVKRSTVSMWEAGRSNPKAKDLPKLAEVLNCSIADILNSDKIKTFK